MSNTSTTQAMIPAGDVDLTDTEVVERVRSWIQERRPSALVRFGEGEGRLLVAQADDEASLRVAANKVKRQAGISISAPQVLELKDLIVHALDEADVVGIHGSDWFNEEHLMWVRKIEEVFEQRRGNRHSPTGVAHCLVSNAVRDALADLLPPRSKVSVVSSRDLKDLLEYEYDVDAQIYQIPSQYVMRNVDGTYESKLHDVAIWPEFINRLREELVVREQGEVFLVGAGLFGKELCIRIRDKGGIALDLGSCLDGLAGKVTRGRRKPDVWKGTAVPSASVPPPPQEAPPQKSIARKVYPYLEKTGWVRSNTSGSSVDAEGNPIPWYRYAAIEFIAERVTNAQRVFEFGCGNSTLWWAARVGSVIAVEHHPGWAKRIAGIAPDNVSIMEIELQPDGQYCRAPLRCEQQFDVIIIDGRDRVNCALQCLPALAPGGIIIWDDSYRRRYRHGLKFLKSNGFKQIRFTGLGPISPEPGETSVLYRADNCFQI